jgi:hypothetical protein
MASVSISTNLDNSEIPQGIREMAQEVAKLTDAFKPLIEVIEDITDLIHACADGGGDNASGDD